MSRIGTYTVEEAREYKALLLQLRAAGFALQGGEKLPALAESPNEVVFYNIGNPLDPFSVVQVLTCELEQNRVVYGAGMAQDSYQRFGRYLLTGPTAIGSFKRGIGYSNYGLVRGDASTYAVGDRLRVKSQPFPQTYSVVEKHPCGNFYCVKKVNWRSQTNIYFVADVGFPAVIDFVAPSPTGIGAATGTTTISMISGDCDIWADTTSRVVPYGVPGTIVDTGFNETIWNKFSTAIPAASRGFASLDNSGLWKAVAWR